MPSTQTFPLVVLTFQSPFSLIFTEFFNEWKSILVESHESHKSNFLLFPAHQWTSFFFESKKEFFKSFLRFLTMSPLRYYTIFLLFCQLLFLFFLFLIYLIVFIFFSSKKRKISFFCFIPKKMKFFKFLWWMSNSWMCKKRELKVGKQLQHFKFTPHVNLKIVGYGYEVFPSNSILFFTLLFKKQKINLWRTKKYKFDFYLIFIKKRKLLFPHISLFWNLLERIVFWPKKNDSF